MPKKYHFDPIPAWIRKEGVLWILTASELKVMILLCGRADFKSGVCKIGSVKKIGYLCGLSRICANNSIKTLKHMNIIRKISKNTYYICKNPPKPIEYNHLNTPSSKTSLTSSTEKCKAQFTKM